MIRTHRAALSRKVYGIFPIGSCSKHEEFQSCILTLSARVAFADDLHNLAPTLILEQHQQRQDRPVRMSFRAVAPRVSFPSALEPNRTPGPAPRSMRANRKNMLETQVTRRRIPKPSRNTTTLAHRPPCIKCRSAGMLFDGEQRHRRAISIERYHALSAAQRGRKRLTFVLSDRAAGPGSRGLGRS